jgi:hypothetical protein
LDEIVLAVSFAFHKHDSSLVTALGHEILEPFYLLVHPYWCLIPELHFGDAILLSLPSCKELFEIDFPMVPDEDSNL